MKWIDMQQAKPALGSRVLVCDEFGWVDIEDVRPVGGTSWLQLWKTGNGTKLVAWMPLPDWPAALCREDADGSMP